MNFIFKTPLKKRKTLIFKILLVYFGQPFLTCLLAIYQRKKLQAFWLHLDSWIPLAMFSCILHVLANPSMLSGIDRISIGTHGRRVIIPGSLVSRRPSKFLMNPGTPHAGGEADVPLLKGMLHNDISRSSHSVNRSTVYAKPALNRSSSDICGPLSPALEKTPILEGQVLLVPGDTTRSVSQNHLPLSSNLSPSSNTLNSLALTSPSPYVRYQSGYPRPVSLSQNLHPQGPQSQYTSTSHISARLSLRSGYTPTAPRGELDNESLTSAFVSNLRPRDIVSPRHPLGSRSISTLLGSVASFPTSLAIVKDDLRRFEPTAPYGGVSLTKGFLSVSPLLLLISLFVLGFFLFL